MASVPMEYELIKCPGCYDAIGMKSSVVRRLRGAATCAVFAATYRDVQPVYRCGRW